MDTLLTSFLVKFYKHSTTGRNNQQRLPSRNARIRTDAFNTEGKHMSLSIPHYAYGSSRSTTIHHQQVTQDGTKPSTSLVGIITGSVCGTQSHNLYAIVTSANEASPPTTPLMEFFAHYQSPTDHGKNCLWTL